MTRTPAQADSERQMAELSVGRDGLRYHRLPDAVTDAKRDPRHDED